MLSPAQQHVVDHRGSDLQIIACAGSGKTESLSSRVAALIAEGAPPESIVAFTFTDRAATELKERIVRRVTERMGAAFRDRLGPMFVGTIHAYCFRILQDHVPRYGSYDVLDENRHVALLSREHRGLGLAKLGPKHWQPIRDFAKAVDVIGNELIPVAGLAGTPLGECVMAWRAVLDRFHFLTYARLISAAVEALGDPAIHARVCRPLRHLLVDEYQDINPAQERLIELLARPPVQLTVVGDDDQSIYQWRGSDLHNILGFAQRRVPVVTFQLDTNRRSRPRIVEAANAFAASIPARLDKRMESVRDASTNEIIPWCAETDDDEGARIADTIVRLHGKPYFHALYNYLLHWARDAYEDSAGEGHADLDAVDVLTVHQAKGLEWPVVFLPSLVTGRFPSRRAGSAQSWLLPESVFPSATRSRYEGGDAEERRLFYVALTRARDAVYLSAFRRKVRRFEPSPYLVELCGEDLPEPVELPLPDAPTLASQSAPPSVDVPFSDLARVDECGLAYRLGTVLGFQQPLAPELGYGKAIHHVLRLLAEHIRATGRAPDRAALTALVESELYVPFATPASFSNMRGAALRLVRRYLDEHEADLHRVWAVERPFALHFDEGVVSGRADVILDEEGGRDGHLAIVDYKVADDPEREARHHLQLAVYTAAGRGEGLAVDAAWLHELRDGTRKSVDVGPDSVRAASERVRALLIRVREGRLDASPADKRCTACDFRRVCRHSACVAP